MSRLDFGRGARAGSAFMRVVVGLRDSYSKKSAEWGRGTILCAGRARIWTCCDAGG